MKNALLFFLLISLKIFSQQATPLNVKNNKGQKNGFWVIYLTDRLIPTKDSLSASYFAYNLYDDGFRVGFFPWVNKDRKKAFKIVTDGPKSEKGKPILLNGIFKFYDKKNQLSLNETYKDGLPVLLEGLRFDKKGDCSMRETSDFTKTYDGQVGSFYYEMYGYDNKLLSSFWFKKKEGKWSYDDPKLYKAK